jgi:glycosyltransferase involved in cell wall biosynthesis
MLVSVIVPMYNSSATIISTLNSIKAQTYKDYEIIIIDDGSNDTSNTLVSNFINKNKDLDIKLIAQNNKGVSSARNVGMKLAAGEWIALLDSDDEWLPNKLQRQIETLNDHPNIDFLGTTRNNEHFKKFFFKKFSSLTKINAKTLLYKSFFLTPTVIFRKKLLHQIGFFDETQQYCEDRYFFLKICVNYECYLLNESLVNTGLGKADYGEKGLSGKLWAMEKGELFNIDFAYKLKIINILEYGLIVIISLMKYIKRIIVSKTRELVRLVND